MKTFLAIGLLLFLSTTASATVDFLSVNKLTKEYYWGDEDNSTGWIGWTTVPEAQLDTAEYDLKKSGYTETFYPYKIESYIFAALSILGLGQYIIRRKLRTTQAVSHAGVVERKATNKTL
jgi:hypothetical protein